jgi:predicted phage terminase large subunit-like protein
MALKKTKSNVPKSEYEDLSGEIDNLLDILCGATPSWFAFTASSGRWRPAEHLLLIEEHILKAVSGKSGRLIINLPPRHGKSEFLSKYLPAWFLGTYPDKRVILTSYESSFAQSFGRNVMGLLKESYDVFEQKIEKNHGASADFGIEGHKGGMYAIGAGGAITGKGADLLIIDDPVKNDAEAMSQTYRDNVYEWFKATAFTRIEPGGSVIIIMTRWHEDDLAGRLLKDEPDKWTLLNMPAIAEENDILGRAEGEPLWSQRYSLEKLAEIRDTIGQFWFSALYQQKPYIEKGGIFKNEDFQYFDEFEEYVEYECMGKQIQVPRSRLIMLASADLAVSVSEQADYTVFIVCGTSADNAIFIFDVIRVKIEGASHIKYLRNIYKRYKPALIGVEAVQYQLSLVQQAQAEGLPVKALRADKDKISRALPLAAKMEAGKVYFKRNAEHLNALIDELLKFPNAKHDDQVDALAYLAEMTTSVSKVRPESAKCRSKSRSLADNLF